MEIIGSIIAAATERVKSLLSFLYGLICGCFAWLALVGGLLGWGTPLHSLDRTLRYLGVGHTEWVQETMNWIAVRPDLVGSVGCLLVVGSTFAAVVDPEYKYARTGSSLLLGGVIVHQSPEAAVPIMVTLGGLTLLPLLILAASYVGRGLLGIQSELLEPVHRLLNPIGAAIVGLAIPCVSLLWFVGGTWEGPSRGASPGAPLHVHVTNRSATALRSGSR